MGIKTKFKVGDKFNRLTIIKYSHSDKHRRHHFLVECECGSKKTVQGSLMLSGNTKSCGCLSKEVKAATRISVDYSEITAVILGYKRHAKGRKLDWGLTREDVESIIKQPCHYCGVEHSNTKITKNTLIPFKYNGIDRKHNNRGYTKENSLPCCKICNRAKLDMPYDDFINWVKAMASQWG